MHGPILLPLRSVSATLATCCICLALAAAPATLRAEGSRVRIVTLGDSITKGVRSGVTAGQTFAALLESQLRERGVAADVVNVGIGGERTDQALRRLEQVLEHEPDLVTVMYGTNDSYVDQGRDQSRISAEAYRENLRKIVVELLRRGIVPVLMTEPRWADDARPNGLGESPNKRLEEYVEVCRETARHWRVPLVDHYAGWSEAREQGRNLRSWTTDGCHPNPLGHADLAERMLPAVQAALRSPQEARQTLREGGSLRVVCFGDSVTGVYYHTGSRRAYADMLRIALERIAPEAEVEVLNAGVSGHTTGNGLERIDRDVIARKPDLVTVMFGLNDMTRVPLEQYRDNLRRIVTQCREAGSEVVLATPNNVIDTAARPTSKLVEYCDAVRQVAAELETPVCDVYRELEAVRAHSPAGWRLTMSDEIHPNMDGHKRLATALAQTIGGQRVSLGDVPPPPPLIHSAAVLREGKPLQVVAMAPLDRMIGPALAKLYPEAMVEVTSWPPAAESLAALTEQARQLVRSQKPDLVLLAPSASLLAGGDDVEAARSLAWLMNYSLNFGPPTWDCVVVHPSVTDPQAELGARGPLLRRLVAAQDLHLIDRPADSVAAAPQLLQAWLEAHLRPTRSTQVPR